MTAPTKPTILRRFNSLPEEIREYFKHFPDLLKKEFPLDVSISYAFSLVETAHNRTIYCGVVKLHKVDHALARRALEKHHMTRLEFKDLYKTILGKKLPLSIVKKIAAAEKVRDQILHGKKVAEKEKRQAIMDIFDYAKAYNAEVEFKPFGSLRGFKGRAKPLEKSTSRWVLKGMGLLR